MTRRIGEDFLGPTDEPTMKANMDNGNDTVLNASASSARDFASYLKTHVILMQITMWEE